MTFTIGQGDTTPALSTTLVSDGSPVDISGYKEVTFLMQNKYEEVVIDENTSSAVNVTDTSNGAVEYIWQQGDTDNIGTYTAQWEVEYSTGELETFPIADNELIIEITETIP